MIISNACFDIINTIFISKLKQLVNKSTKLRVQTNLDSRFKTSVRKMSTYGHKKSHGVITQPTGKYGVIIK